MTELRAKTARVFQPLLKPHRYKGAYGGRGSGKSHHFATQVALAHIAKGQRTVCVREVQKSLEQSAKRLIEDKIRALGLIDAGFAIYKDRIKTPGDGLILFQGMQDHNADSIKSLENFDRSWCEEAHVMSSHSLELLRPTIRKDEDELQHTLESELWFSWNPRLKHDPVDVMFRGKHPPTDSVSVMANWNDNPWFPKVLEQERLDCYHYEPEQYEHIWEGAYVSVRKGAYYAKSLTVARSEGRIAKVGPDPLITYRAFIDIGGTGARSDAFAIWIVQFVAREIRCLDYYEAQGQELGAHLEWLRNNGYDKENTSIWLPHDGATHDKVYRVSYESAFRDAGFTTHVVPNQGRGAAAKRIEEARRLFPIMYFDEERCRGGLEALAWYHEKQDEARNIGLGPEHDWSSHAADAFGLIAVAYEPPRAHKARPTVRAGANVRMGNGRRYRSSAF